MDRLPLELTLEPTRLLCYSSRHPFLHIVDTGSARDLPVSSAADLSGQAIDRVRRIEGYLVTEINGVVTLPEHLGEPWLHLGEGRPYPALDPSLLWLHSRARKRVVLMTGEGERKRVVHTGDGLVNFMAEVSEGLLLMIEGVAVLHTGDGGTRGPGVWADLEIAASSPDGIVGIRRAERHRLLRFDVDGALTGEAEVDPRMGWSWQGAASPSLRHYVSPIREIRADLSRDEKRRLRYSYRADVSFVLADLDTGCVTEIGCLPHAPQHLGYITWNRTGRRVFVCDPYDDELLTFSVHDPVLRRVSDKRLQSAPLIELSDEARKTGLPTDLVRVTQD